MKPTLPLTLALATAALGACAHHTRSAPALSAAPVAAESPPSPQQPGFFSRTADATWNVVSAPVRLVTPQKPAATKAPPVYDAPEAIIITPSTDASVAPATQPQ